MLIVKMSSQSTASRLCSACGICCNGVLFHKVRLLPSDSTSELTAHGLRLKHKRGEKFCLQPCPAYQESHCTIYEQRPERCRLFECQQLRRVATEEISEKEALNKIQEVLGRIARINELLDASGKTNPKKPLTKRFEKITAEPVDPNSDPKIIERRAELIQGMQELEELFDRDFRVRREN